MDLQEATRRDDVFKELVVITDKLSSLPVFPSLAWVWAFDIMANIHENESVVTEWADEVVPEGTTLKEIFDKFWEDVDSLGINMDFGGEVVEETIRDWMRDNDFLVSLDDDGWLDEEDEDEIPDDE